MNDEEKLKLLDEGMLSELVLAARNKDKKNKKTETGTSHDNSTNQPDPQNNNDPNNNKEKVHDNFDKVLNGLKKDIKVDSSKFTRKGNNAKEYFVPKTG